MAKDKSGKKSAISEAGTLSLDTNQFERALKTKDYRNGGSGGGLLPINKDGYRFIVQEIIRGVSAGDKTKGAPNYQVKMTLDDPEHTEYEGKPASLFFIAHGNTGGKYLKFLEVVGGIAPKDIDPKDVPIPSQDEVNGWTGTHVLVSVDGHSPDYKNPEITRADYTLLERVGGSKKAKKVGAGKIAK